MLAKLTSPRPSRQLTKYTAHCIYGIPRPLEMEKPESYSSTFNSSVSLSLSSHERPRERDETLAEQDARRCNGAINACPKIRHILQMTAAAAGDRPSIPSVSPKTTFSFLPSFLPLALPLRLFRNLCPPNGTAADERPDEYLAKLSL